MCRSLLIPLLVCAAWCGAGRGEQYLPTWASLDSRPLPPWYDQAKIGIFIHWGVYSVPSFGTEWFWNNWKGKRIPRYEQFMKENYPPDFTYRDFGPQFKAEFYEPEEWAELFKASGARYVVLTGKHHEGYTLWPSKYSWGWNSVDVGPKRDLLGDLARALRSKAPELRFGVYYSLYEWFNPIFLMDKANKLRTKHFVSQKVIPELLDLVNTYRPEVVWSDGEWEAPYHYWNSTEFLAWLFNSSPVKDTVVVNDRWGSGPILCRHGSFYTCADRFNPGVLQPHKWENAMTLDRWSWGYRRRAKVRHYLSIHALLTRLAMTVSCGGNLLVNVGPTKDGLIPPIMEERLRQMGTWLAINGEAIYESQPWKYQNDTLTPGVWFTSREGTVYAMVLRWPEGDTLTLGSVLPTDTTTVTMLGHASPLQFQAKEGVAAVTFPKMSVVRGQWVWVLALSDVAPRQPPTTTTTTTQ